RTRLLAQALVGEVERVGVTKDQTLDRGAAALVVQRREQAAEQRERVDQRPPNCPLCTPARSTRSSTMQSTRPRSDVVIAGWPTRQCSESATTITSAASSSQ